MSALSHSLSASPVNPTFHPDLVDRILRDSSAGPHSFHGIRHWRDVEVIGAWLAAQTGADPAVVAHFAWLHDSCRMDDGYDGNHGHRAAAYVATLSESGLICLDQEQTALLIDACRDHNTLRALTSSITVMTCWDADRLDLLRLRIMPDVQYLHTSVARHPDTLDAVRKLILPQEKGPFTLP